VLSVLREIAVRGSSPCAKYDRTELNDRSAAVRCADETLSSEAEAVMAVYKFKPLRSSMRADALFTRPILEWEHVSTRFFVMVRDALAGKTNPSIAEFSVQSATVLAEVRARYRLFGGAASIVIQPDRLVFDFPNLVPAEYPIVSDVIAAIHDAFPKAFPELKYERVETNSLEHLDLVEIGAVERFLDQHKIALSENAFPAPVVMQPGLKFTVVAQDQSWQCALIAERSLLSATALFIMLNLSIRNLENAPSYSDKVARIRAVTNSVMRSIGLESANAAST
jgi:hypothetical protein